MMFKRIGFFFLFIFLGLSTLVFGQSSNGKIIDVFGKNATVQMDSDCPFRTNDKIDLSYMADTMEFLLGQYEVTQVKGNVFIAKEISSTMPPSKDMKVKLVPSQDLYAMMKNSGQGAPVKEKSSQNGFLDQVGDLFKGSTKTETSDEKIEGEVAEILAGNDVRIQLSGSGSPKVGDAADLFFVTSQGTRLMVGTWEVKTITNREVMASPLQNDMIPKVGLKAVIHKNDSLKTSSDPRVVQGETTNRDAAATKMAARTYPVQVETIPNTAQNTVDSQSPQVYPDFNSFRQAVQNNQSPWIEQKWVLGVQIKNAQGVEWPNTAKFLSGVYIVEVTPNTPAQKAGLLPGDIIFHVDNTPVQNVPEFMYLLNASNGKVVLNIKRSPDIYKAIIKSVRLIKFEASLYPGQAPELFDQIVPGMPIQQQPIPEASGRYKALEEAQRPLQQQQ